MRTILRYLCVFLAAAGVFMAAKYLEILTPEQLKESIRTIFASKGEAVVEMNCKAFEIGLNA